VDHPLPSRVPISTEVCVGPDNERLILWSDDVALVSGSLEVPSDPLDCLSMLHLGVG
jgi:hypothetical protein